MFQVLELKFPSRDGSWTRDYATFVSCHLAHGARSAHTIGVRGGGGGGFSPPRIFENFNFRAKIHIIFGQHHLIFGQALDKIFGQETSTSPPPPKKKKKRKKETGPVHLWHTFPVCSIIMVQTTCRLVN